jgi:hypothetical protein
MAGLTRHPLKIVKHQFSKFRNIIINDYQGIEPGRLLRNCGSPLRYARNDKQVDFLVNPFTLVRRRLQPIAVRLRLKAFHIPAQHNVLG